MIQIAWSLQGCCGTEETVFLAFYGGYVVTFFLLYSTTLMKPMRLLAVFCHEFSHATLCWLTGGSVKKIEVYNNEGGVTGYTGGIRCCVIPAGYVGAALWGGLFVALSGSRIGATALASLLVLAFLMALCSKPNKIVVALGYGFATILIAAMLIDWFVFNPIIQYVTLFFGVFIGFYAVRDIYDDLIRRTAEGSDAVACHQICPCCLPRCVGVQFWIAAFGFQCAGLYLALVWMLSEKSESVATLNGQ